MKKSLLTLFSAVVIVLSTVGCSGNVVEHETYQYSNPVYGCGADPSIIKADDGYYYVYVTSENYDWEGTGQSYQSTGPILRSKNLTEFEYVGCVFPDGVPNWSRAHNAGVWAPDIVYRNNKYYYYYSLGVFSGDIKASGIGVATSDYPAGPWTDHGKILDGYDVENPNPIDPCVKVDKDGRVYMFYGSFKGSMDYIELDQDGITPLNKDKKNYGKKKMFDCGLEGCYIFEANGYYYFMGSGGTMNQGLNSTYYVVCYRSKELFGSYVDAYGNDAAFTPNNVQSYVITPSKGYAKGTGHNAIIQDDDGIYYIVYHAYDQLGWETNKKRKLLIDRLYWDENKMPYVSSIIDGVECKFTSSLGTTFRAPYIDGEANEK